MHYKQGSEPGAAPPHPSAEPGAPYKFHEDFLPISVMMEGAGKTTPKSNTRFSPHNNATSREEGSFEEGEMPSEDKLEKARQPIVRRQEAITPPPFTGE